MNKPSQVPQVGAPDPELKTSPIFEREGLDAEDFLSLDLEHESRSCYFNDVSYPIGQYVLSGSDLLRCEERGVWVQKTETAKI